MSGPSGKSQLVWVNRKRIINKYEKMGKIFNTSEAMKRVTAYMYGSINRNFKGQGRPRRWVPLSPVTIAMRKAGKGKGTPQALLDTGRLRQSVTGPPFGATPPRLSLGLTWRQATGPTLQVTPRSTVFGTNLSYATAQHFGRGRIKQKVKGFNRKLNKKTKDGRSEVRVKAHTRLSAPIPARPFLMFQRPEDVNAIVGKKGILARYIQENDEKTKVRR